MTLTLTQAVQTDRGLVFGLPGVLTTDECPPLAKDVFLRILKFSSDLTLADFKNFRLINRACRAAADMYITDVQSKYTFKRRVDAAANRFMDRPLWQRVAIVTFVTLTSPVSVPILLTLKSPKIYAKYKDSHILPAVRKVATAIEKVAKFIFVTVPSTVSQYILEPVAKQAKKAAKWTNETVVTPVTEAVTAVAKAVFVTFPSYLNRTIFTPLSIFTQERIITPALQTLENIAEVAAKIAKRILDEVVVPLVDFTVTNLVAPTAKVIKAIAKAVFITLPFKTVKHVIIPLFTHVIIPVAKVVGIVAKAIFVTLPLKVVDHVLSPIATKVVVPVARVVATIAKATLVTLPVKVFQNVVLPVARFLGEGVKITYSTLLKPAAKLVEFVASKIFLEFIPAAVVAVWSPVSSLVVEVTSATVDFGRFVFSKLL